MNNLLLQVEFANLANPLELSMGLAITISVLLILIVWAGIRLRSPAILASWSLLGITLMFTFITNLSFIWFWVVVMLIMVLISIVATVKFAF